MKRSRRMLQELEQDIRDHIAQETDDNIARGMSPEDARAAAMRKFGNVLRVKEDSRSVWVVVWLEQLLQDIRFGLRLLRKSPGFTLTAVLTLALAIGANAVVFSVINAFILHPLSLPSAENVYQLERGKDKVSNQSYPDYVDLRDRNHTFEGIAAYDVEALALDVNGSPSRVWSEAVTSNYFDVLRVQPYAGRFFHASDEHGPDSAPYIVLGYSYWHTHFKDDRKIVGRVVQLNKHPFTVLGIAAPDFHGTLMIFHPDVFVPFIDQQVLYGQNNLNARGSRSMFAVVGRLKDGVSRAQAIADLNAIGADLEKTYPKDDGDMKFALARPGLYGDYLGPVIQAFLTGLLMLSGLILLAACANLGSLFAARAAERSREVALRLAVGAGRMRILRQIFTESILISLIGGALGVWCSVLLLSWLSHWQPFPMWPLRVPVDPDVKVYLLALLLSVVSGFLFGAVPVRQVLRTDPYDIVKSGTRTTAERRFNVRDVLLVVQIAICAVLVTSSIVAVRGLVRSLHGDFGIDPEHALLVEADLNNTGYRGDAVASMQKKMLDAMQSIPGVNEAALVDAPPLGPNSGGGEAVFADATTDLRPANAIVEGGVINVSPGYFHAARTALLSGRGFTWHDDKSSPRVAVVNQEFARKVFGTVSSALGGYFKTAKGGRIQVVAVAQDGKYGSLTEDPQPVIFYPLLQSPSTETFVIVRSDAPPQQLVPLIRRKLLELDAELPATIQTWDQAISAARFGARIAAMSLGVLGVMAAMLAITGIFGMATYSLSRRLKELGIRIALGAQPREVLQAALGRAFKLLAFGSAAGLVLGLLASRVLAAIVYQATPRDPIVLASVVLAMLLLGLLATWIPAQRALAIDPLMLLREE